MILNLYEIMVLMARLLTLFTLFLLFSCLSSQKEKRQIRGETKSGGNIDPGDSCYDDSNLDTCFGKPVNEAFGADKYPQKINLSFVFVNSSDTILSFDSNHDADLIISKLNDAFNDDSHQHLKFNKLSVEEVYDDRYFIANCSDFDEVFNSYGKTNAMTVVIVYGLQGGCSGVAHIWTSPAQRYSGIMVEYDYDISYSAGVYAHELGHNFGLHHSAETYTGSVPETGLKSFNKLVKKDRLLEKSCKYDFYYFVDPNSESMETEKKGIMFNSFENMMYPSYGDGFERSFFTEGYDYSVSRAFDCWYSLAKESGIGLSLEANTGDQCERIATRGDIDDDGVITDFDYKEIKSLYEDGVRDLVFDFDNNGRTETDDLDLLQKYQLGLICQ